MHEDSPNPESEFFESIQNSPMSAADLQVAPQLLQGMKLLELHNEEQALDVFRSAMLQSPCSFKALYLFGQTALALELFPEATEAFQNALALDPENVEVKYLIAHLHILQDMVEEAAGELQTLLKERPDVVDAYYDCGVALQLLGRYGDAIAVFLRRLEISPDFDTSIMCAMTYEMLQDYENTEKYYAQALALDPENIMVIESHGKTLMEMERYEDALVDFNRAIDLDPESPDARCGRGQTYFHLGKIDLALADLLATIKLDPENMIAWGMLGQVKLYQEEYKPALEYIEKAIEIDPELLIYDFRASAKRGLGDLQGALDDISLALEFEPENTDYMIDKGSILTEMDRLDEAVQVFDQVLAVEPNPDAYRFRGMTRMEQMDYEQAIDDFTHAESLGSTNPDLFLRRGEALYQLGERDAAFGDFRKAAEIAGQNGDEELSEKCTHLLKKMQELDRDSE